MLNDIHVFDDIISKDNQNLLEKYFKESNLRWDYGNNLKYLNNSEKSPQFVLRPENVNNDIIDSLITEIQTNSLRNLNKTILTNYRYKVNWLRVSDTPDNFDNRKVMHIDRYEPHISIVYYINDTDGDTSFYDLNDGDVFNWMEYVKNNQYYRFSHKKACSPKKGRVVVFDGSIFHHSSYPTKMDRYVINFNTVIKTEPKTLF